MALALRGDFDAARLRLCARHSGDADQVRRLLALAAIYDGASRMDAASVGGVTRQIVRDWVERFNAGGPDALIARKAPGKPPLLKLEQRAALVQWVWDRFAVSISRQTLGRELRAMSCSQAVRPPASACPSRRRGGGFQKDFPATVAAIARDHGLRACDVEVWFGDEARVGQKNKITRRWAQRGTRPSAPQDQRTTSTYIFGAICPTEGKAAGLVLPWCNTEAMTLHLAEISARVAPGRHAALVVDQAGWHLSAELVVPANITIVPLPPKCPELNPQENVWQFMRDNCNRPV